MFKGESRSDIFPRFQNEFCAFFFDKLVQYPPTLKAYIPALFFHPNHWESRALFRLLLKGASRSPTELEELRKVDQKLLKIHEKPILKSTPGTKRGGFGDVEYGESDFSLPFSQCKAESGQYYVDVGGSYAALAKQIVRILWAK
jgi:hypothetical protein